MQIRKLKIGFINIFIWILFVGSFLWLSKSLLLGNYPDFRTQYFATLEIFKGHNPYLGGQNLFTPQVYPPTTSFFYLPFTLLPIGFSQIVFIIFSLFCLILVFVILSKIFEISFFSKTNLILMSFAFISFPTKFTFGMGQINIFILLFLIFALYFLKKEKEFLSGLFLGISIVLKFFPLFLPIYLVVRSKKDKKSLGWLHLNSLYSLTFRKKRFSVSPGQIKDDVRMLEGIWFFVILSVIVVLAFIPWQINWRFLTNVIPDLLSSWKLDYYNQSLSGFVGRSWGTGEFAMILRFVLSLIISVITLFIVAKNKEKDFMSNALKYGLFITTSLLVNTFSWQHHFVWLIIPFYVTVLYLSKASSRGIYFAIITVAYILVSINFKNPSIFPILFQSHVFFGTLVLWLLNLYLLRK